MPLPSSAMVMVRGVSPVWGVSSAGRSVSASTAMRTRVAPALREFCNASVITSESVLA